MEIPIFEKHVDLKGTCDFEDCEFHNKCHCGCGNIPSIAVSNQIIHLAKRGNPYMYVKHHNRKYRQPNNKTGCFVKNGKDIQKAKQCLGWLKNRYETWNEVGRITNLSPSFVKNIYYSKHRRNVSPITADKISKAILLHKRGEDIFVSNNYL